MCVPVVRFHGCNLFFCSAASILLLALLTTVSHADEAFVYVESDSLRMVPVGSAVGAFEQLSPAYKGDTEFALSQNARCIVVSPRTDSSGSADREWRPHGPLHVQTRAVADRALGGFGIALSPDGSRFAYVHQSDGATELSIEATDSGEGKCVSKGWKAVQTPSWSKNGKKVAFFCVGNSKSDVGLRLHVLDVGSGLEIEIAGPSKSITFGGEFREPAIWSSDGKQVYFDARYEGDPEGRQIYAADVSGKTPPRWIAVGSCGSLSPDGKVLYFADGNIYSVRVDIPDAKPSLLIPNAHHPRISPSGKAMVYMCREGLFCRMLATGKDTKISDHWPNNPGRAYWTTLP